MKRMILILLFLENSSLLDAAVTHRSSSAKRTTVQDIEAARQAIEDATYHRIELFFNDLVIEFAQAKTIATSLEIQKMLDDHYNLYYSLRPAHSGNIFFEKYELQDIFKRCQQRMIDYSRYNQRQLAIQDRSFSYDAQSRTPKTK